jgi:acyl dehydratase
MVKLVSQFEPGEKYTTDPHIVTATDIENFARTTRYEKPIFLDEQYARDMGFKDRIAQGGFTLSLTTGLIDSSGILDDAIALAGLNNVRFMAPVYPYDTLRVEVELLSRRVTADGKRAVCTLKWVTRNQNGEAVAEGEHVEICRAVYP